MKLPESITEMLKRQRLGKKKNWLQATIFNQLKQYFL